MGRSSSVKVWRRKTVVVVAGVLAAVMMVDPFGMSAASSFADDLESRAESFDDVISALGLAGAAEAVPLTGSWGSLPGAGGVQAAPAVTPTEDEQVVVLGEDEDPPTAPAALGLYTTEDPPAPPAPVSIELGGLDVTVAPAGLESTPAAVRLRVAGEQETAAAGVTGVLLEASDESLTPAAEPEVELTVSYATFAGLVYGDWASRLRFVWIPDCETPGGTCTPQALETVNDPETQTVTARVPVTEGEPVTTTLASARSDYSGERAATGGSGGGSLAIMAGSSGDAGDWGATSLAASSTWGTSGSTGALTWSQPVLVPSVPAGPSPTLGISYSSAGADGRTPAENNQTGQIGEGFTVTEGYVERTYAGCSNDETGSATNIGRISGDLCWGEENATMMFNGSAVELIRDATTGEWHPKVTDGSKIEHITGSSWNTGEANEYWKLTTSDGTQYYFGRGKVSSGSPALNSAWTVPVYGNHPGERCYQPDFADAACEQVWRWNLEYIVDPSGNSMTYFYSTETNRYLYDVTDNAAGNTFTYTSAGRLDRIEYGTRAGSETSGTAPAKVTFTYRPRCITDLGDADSFCNSGQTSTTANYWLDTPIDLICSSSVPDTCTNYTPVFFSRTRLSAISTATYDGTGYHPVDTWTLNQTFDPEGSGIAVEFSLNAMLVLRSIAHTGHAGTSTTSDDITSPPLTFTYEFFANRVDTPSDGALLIRPRVVAIRTDSGAQISLSYLTDCGPGDSPGTSESAQAANTRLCFPVRWFPNDGGDPVTEYFHKYVVSTIVESGAAPVAPGSSELITGSLDRVTTFGYSGGAAWAQPTGAMVEPDEVTYSDFRGVATVTTTIGVGDDATSSRTTYYRGTGVTLTAGPTGTTVSAVDREEYQGEVFASTTMNGTTPVSETVTTMGFPVVMATSAAGLEATRLPSQTTDGFVYDAAGDLVHHTRQAQTYDANSQVTSIDDRGDLGRTADDTCTTTTYAAASDSGLAAKNLVALVSETRVVSVPCATSPSLPGDLIAGSTSTYDASGRVARVERLDPVDGVGTILVSRVLDYDDRGRPVETSDEFGNILTTVYEESTGGLTETVITIGPDPDGWGPLSGFQTVTHLDPITGLATSTVDANGLVTSATYDALGRVLTVHKPEQQGEALPSVVYEYVVDPNGLNAVVTKTLGADGASQQVSVVLYDGLLRMFQTQNPGRDAGEDHDATALERGRIVAHTYYDSAGRVVRQTGDWWAEGAPSVTPIVPIAVPPSSTTYDYDAAGRVVAELFWIGTESNPMNEQWRTVTAYDGPTTLVIPPLGGTPQASIVDARGQVVERIQYLRDPDDDAAADTPEEVLALQNQRTTYEFDSAGLLVEMQDPDDNVWAYDYDWGGRLIESDDPDGGTITTTYDAADRVVTRTNGNGDTLAYTYDVLGRTITLRDDSVSGTIRAQWAYDSSLDEDNDPVLGQLSSSTRFVGGEAYTTSIDRYDDAYRTLATTFTLPDLPEFEDALDSRSFTTEYTYTADGQISSVALPAVVSQAGAKALGAETVTTRFDAASVASWMSGGFGWGTYVAESRVTADARVSALDLGNTYGTYLTYQYEDGTERLSNISLTRQAHGLELSLDYGYDAAGNVTSIFDQASTLPAEQDNQCFGYDGLSQLEVAWSSASGDCAVAQSALTTADVGGVSPYWTEYEYDALGNRTDLVEHGIGGASTSVTTYAHGGVGLGAHQLGAMVETVGGASTTTSFAYDDAGNRISSITGGDSTDYTWDAEGELTGVDDDEYVYDASGSRIVRSDEAGTTVYLPGGQEVLISPEGDVSATRYYSFSGLTVAVRESRGLSGVTSLVHDHQGSVVASVPNTDWSPGSVQVVRTDPYGGARDGSDEGVPGDKRFLGLTHDEGSGLSLFGARYYDAVTGTFLSVDPVLDPAVPAQFNAYVYAWNNPVTCSDPTGQTPGKKKGSNGGKGKSTHTPPPGPADRWDDLVDSVKPGVQDLVQSVSTTPPYVAFAQDPGAGVWWFNMWGWDRDQGGNYHANQDGWQQHVGYGDWIDELFGWGTDIADPLKYEFGYGDETYVFWAWKADYLALGAGAELGIYRKGAEPGQLNPEWNVDKDAALQMSMTLSYRGAQVAEYSPDEDQWWCTTWVPSLQNADPADITATYTVDFSNDQDMFDAFRAEWERADSPWQFNPDTRTATIKYRRKRKETIST